VRKLASGDGVGCSYRDGLFAEGEKVCMRTDLEALQQAAWDWLPLKSCPAWMKVASGERAHYEALGVEPAASAAAIEEAFRSAEAKREEHAPETWERIAKAFETLSDERRRHKYDWVPINYKPPPGVPLDKSNGWILNHPITKMQIYQRYLHVLQVKATTREDKFAATAAQHA